MCLLRITEINQPQRFIEGSSVDVYNSCCFYKIQNIVVYANLMSQVLYIATNKREETTGARSKDAIIRGKF